MARTAVACSICGQVTDDVYYRTPGSGLPSDRPLCTECYERGWRFYWREQFEAPRVRDRALRSIIRRHYRASHKKGISTKAGQRPDELLE